MSCGLEREYCFWIPFGRLYCGERMFGVGQMCLGPNLRVERFGVMIDEFFVSLQPRDAYHAFVSELHVHLAHPSSLVSQKH